MTDMPKTAAETRIEEIAKASQADGKSIAKARADAWIANPDLYEQDGAERRSPAFLAKIEKQASEARIAKGGDRYTKMKSAAEISLDVMAQKHASQHGTTIAKAWAAILQTEDGQRLYAESRAA
jgi:hypothetical protein